MRTAQDDSYEFYTVCAFGCNALDKTLTYIAIDAGKAREGNAFINHLITHTSLTTGLFLSVLVGSAFLVLVYLLERRHRGRWTIMRILCYALWLVCAWNLFIIIR